MFILTNQTYLLTDVPNTGVNKPRVSDTVHPNNYLIRTEPEQGTLYSPEQTSLHESEGLLYYLLSIRCAFNISFLKMSTWSIKWKYFLLVSFLQDHWVTQEVQHKWILIPTVDTRKQGVSTTVRIWVRQIIDHNIHS